MYNIRIAGVFLVACAFLFSVFVEAAFELGTQQQLSDFPGAPKGSVYNEKTDGALLGGCGPGAKEFLKKKSSNPASIDGLKPSFACALQKLIQSNPGVTIGVGTYKTTASSASGADCSRVQCREGANANGGTHEKGCAADLLYNGQKGPIGPAGPPWCKSNHLCSAVHQKAPGLGLQFRLMPGHPGFPGTAEVWHVELNGAKAGYCPDSAEGGSGGSSGGGSPSSGQQGGGSGSDQGSGEDSTNKSQITPEYLEHEQIEKDPNILKGSNTLAGQEDSVFEGGAGEGTSGPSFSGAASGGSENQGGSIPTESNVVQQLIEQAGGANENAPASPQTGGFFSDAQNSLSEWWYGGLDRLFGGGSSAAAPAPSPWQSLRSSTPSFQFRFFGF